MPRLATLRYTGLAAAVLLAVVGWLGGALPHGDLASTPLTIARGPFGPFILCGWAVGTALLSYVWWAARDRVSSARWSLGTAAIWAAPFLVTPPMGSRDLYSYACQGVLYVNGLSPYENGVGALECPWIDGVSPIWRDTAAPYGPLFVMLSAAGVRFSGGSFVLIVVFFRVLALLGLLAVAAGLPVLARRCGISPARAWWVALAGPLVGAHLIAGPHNDALMVGLIVAGLALAVLGSHPGGWACQVAAGLLLGFAVAIKVTAIVVVPFAVLIVVARPYRWRSGGVLFLSAVAAMVGVTAASGLGFGWIGAMVNTKDLVQFTSPPTAIGMTLTYAGQLVDPGFDAVPVVRVLALVLFALVVVALWWRSAAWGRAKQPPNPLAALGLPVTRAADPVASALRGAALAMAATVVLSPYFHPWYAFWALALLAATTIRTDLVMAAATAGPLLVLADGGGLARFVKFPGAPLMTLLLIFVVVRHFRPAIHVMAAPSRRERTDVTSRG
ncbi:polyprenol phosphomannose-dependent alpha 1,6 mannosyltransferase MptB [Actinoplanes sp. CA-142083]|uniref:polyprenol phosphomannose-dependent alpha 1,6 mannosyltransferase MptB n=1 Tax=Actinoplanes sp. CA-142083 TaxID=3239903 RepID=UPI003D90493D